MGVDDPSAMAGAVKERIDRPMRALMIFANRTPTVSTMSAAIALISRERCTASTFGTPIATAQPELAERLNPPSTWMPSRVGPSTVPSELWAKLCRSAGEAFVPTNSSARTVRATVVPLLSRIATTQSEEIFCRRKNCAMRSGNITAATP